MSNRKAFERLKMTTIKNLAASFHTLVNPILFFNTQLKTKPSIKFIASTVSSTALGTSTSRESSETCTSSSCEFSSCENDKLLTVISKRSSS